MSQNDFTLNLVCANLRSFIAKEKRNALERATLTSKANVFAFSETWWPNLFEDNELSLPGFHLYRRERPTERKTKHRGVMIAVSNSIRHQPLDIIDEYDSGLYNIYCQRDVSFDILL